MITRGLLVEAAEVCVKAHVTSMEAVRRRLRVGFVTIAGVFLALQTLGIIEPTGDGRWRARRARAGRHPLEIEIDAAIADGLIVVEPAPPAADPTVEVTDDTIGEYWDQCIAGHVAAIPDRDAVAAMRARYIRDVRANPTAVHGIAAWATAARATPEQARPAGVRGPERTTHTDPPPGVCSVRDLGCGHCIGVPCQSPRDEHSR